MYTTYLNTCVIYMCKQSRCDQFEHA